MRYALDARTSTARFPGIGRYAGNLARALAAEIAEEDRLVVLGDKTADPHWNGPLTPAENVEWIEAPLSPFSLRQQWVLPRVLRRARADLYHSPYYLMPYRVRMPTVLTFYDSIPIQHPRSVSLLARHFFRPAARLALRSASHVITPSEATRRDLLRSHRLDPERVSVVPLAASPHLRPPPEPETRRVREKLGLPANYVLHLGAKRPHKNLEGLLAAWRIVEREEPAPPVLVIAGAGYGERSRSALPPPPPEHEGAIRLIGVVAEEDLAGLLGGAALFVFPSLDEGFGLPVIEAMACGAPVLCSDRSALREITADAALHFDPSRPGDIAAAIRRALSDVALTRELSRRGLARARRFSWPATASLTLDVYQNVLAASGDRRARRAASAS